MDRPGGTIERVGGYRVVRRLATGGTADVLLAKAEGPHGFERTVVLKLLLAQFRDDEDSARMFAREASAYARLSHPCVVQLYDFFALEGQLVMVLEYVDGPPLNRLRGMLKAVGQQLDDQASIYVAARVFEALAAAHGATDEAGGPAPVIHRDVNPSNVLVQWDGQVKLADFGVAKVTGVTGVSRVGLLHGTFGYMAPEQVEGGNVTPRADVYAGAVILWELLTRRRAFMRGALPEVEVLRQMAEPKIVSLDVLRPDVDKNVRDAIRRALEPDHRKRSITAEEMVAILRASVTSDTGREHLGRALVSVRHEPKPAMSIPPADLEPPTLGGAKPGLIPRASIVPRAEIALKRTPSQPPVQERTSQLPSTQPYPSTGRDGEKAHVNIRDSIDDILKEIPSSIPPATFRGGRGSAPDSGERRGVIVTGGAEDTAASQAEAMDRTVAMVGAPERPATMLGLAPMPLAHRPTAPTVPSPETQRTPPPPVLTQATTAPMPPVVPPAATTLPLLPSPQPDPRPMSVAPPPGIPQPTTSSLSASMSSGIYPDLDDPPPKRGAGLAVVLALVVLAIAGGAGTMGYMRWKSGTKARVPTPASASVAVHASASASASASAPASAPASASASASAPASAPAPASASAAVPPPPAVKAGAGTGVIHTAGAPKGHRIYVDGVVAGQTPEDVTVKCGLHVVKISGKTRQVSVPCGGEAGIF